MGDHPDDLIAALMHLRDKRRIPDGWEHHDLLNVAVVECSETVRLRDEVAAQRVEIARLRKRLAVMEQHVLYGDSRDDPEHAQ